MASAPAGTVTSISLGDRTVKEACVCPKFTSVILKKFSPVTVIMSPAAALAFSKSPTLIASPEAKVIVGCVPNISFAFGQVLYAILEGELCVDVRQCCACVRIRAL